MNDDDPQVAVRCLLDREANTVSIVLVDIPMEHLDQVLTDMCSDSWRTNIADGIRAQHIAGPALGLITTKRNFYTGDES